MKILIVDDEPSIVNLIKLNLKLEGYDTVCAYTGREAIGIYAAEAPDIVLLDIMLPDMDGYDVLRAIQEIDHSAAVIFFMGVFLPLFCAACCAAPPRHRNQYTTFPAG